MTAFLTFDDVVDIHRQVIEATGGADGVRDVGLLDSAVHRPQTTFGGVFLYPTLAKQGAALLHSLAKNHPFVDGNKRTAYTATKAFLRLNAADILASADDKYDFVIGVASGELSFEGMVEWIENHLRLEES